MKLHKSFIAKFVQASLFSCLSFSAYAQDVNSEENKPLVPSNEKEYEAAKASITEHINNAVDRIKKEEEKIVYDRKVEGKSVFLTEMKVYQDFIISLLMRTAIISLLFNH